MTLEQTNIFFGDILKNLKIELELLNVKIKESRESENFGIYKNLIQTYKEILNIYTQVLRDTKIYD